MIIDERILSAAYPEAAGDQEQNEPHWMAPALCDMLGDNDERQR